MKFSEYPKLGLSGTIVGVVAVAIIVVLLLLGIWIDPSMPIWGKIVTTIVVIFFGGGLVVMITGGYKVLHAEVFFPEAGEK